MRLFGLLAAALLLPASLRAQYTRADTERPRLVVFLTIDQMRPDYLDRWAGQLMGGLARLSRNGAFFTNAFQDHGVTETAPGHSVTMSGRFPRSTGILRNTAGVEDPQSPLLTSTDLPASPYRFRGSVLIDWIRARDAGARALSVSRKDRGAILPLGRAKQNVFWYATSTGEFTTSRYYADTLPDWIKGFNTRRLPQKHVGDVWNLLLNANEYAEPDSEPIENSGKNFLFPHQASASVDSAVADLPATPWMDQITLQLAIEGLQALQLGRGTHTDLLAVSLSATDYIGHRYGPDSREQHDNILRLDRALGAFIDSLYKLRDSSTIVFALTADHGVTSYPELVAKRSNMPPQARYDYAPAVAGLKSALAMNHVSASAVVLDGGLVYVDRTAFSTAKVDPEPILRRFLGVIASSPGVARVDRVRDLVTRDTVHDAVSRRWVHMIPTDSPVEYVITPKQGAYAAGAKIAEHGLPYDDDAHVPVIFYGPGFKGGRYGERALVVDVAPTLASVIGVPPTERVDGHVLTQAVGTGQPRR